MTKFQAFGILLFVFPVDLLVIQEKEEEEASSVWPHESEGCDQRFVSTADGIRNGTFFAPRFRNFSQKTDEEHLKVFTNAENAVLALEEPLPKKISTQQPPLQQCLISFEAQPNERVLVSFEHFNLRSLPPECNREFLDIFAEIREDEIELYQTSLSGRYCGQYLPRTRVSRHQRLVLAFQSERPRFPNTPLFFGHYEFIDQSQFEFGYKLKSHTCAYEIWANEKREGQLRSPTYPGVYPQPLHCTYFFRGERGQRIRLEFIDLDLFSGGNHCPYDFVRLYDGVNTSAPEIITMCGQKRSWYVYSTDSVMMMEFHATARQTRSENRGFMLSYEFSERFVNLGFIDKSGGQHVKGTECDQKIFSKNEESGELFSPNYPFLYQTGVQCNYLLLGLNDQRNLQRVRVYFEKFDVPSQDQECTESFVRIYTGDLENEEADQVFCGSDAPATTLYSDGSVFKLLFASGSQSPQGQGFRARYTFEQDYKVPGTPWPSACRFSYESSSTAKHGWLNSPRFPAAYPIDLECEYHLKPQPEEYVVLVFNAFKLHRPDILASTPGYGIKTCNSDWVEVSALIPTSTSTNGMINGKPSTIQLPSKAKSSSAETLLLGRWCGHSAPGPLFLPPSLQNVIIKFHSDSEGSGSGFKASYTFRRQQPAITCSLQADKAEIHGLLTNPGFPAPFVGNYSWCQSMIRVRPGYRVLLHFIQFSIEGDMKQRGCPTSVVRLWPRAGHMPVELCGDQLPVNRRNFLSEQDQLQIEFLATTKAVGAAGFKAHWTEVKVVSDTENTDCLGAFKCRRNGFCIARSMVCNGLPNCGHGDNSDEHRCQDQTS